MPLFNCGVDADGCRFPENRAGFLKDTGFNEAATDMDYWSQEADFLDTCETILTNVTHVFNIISYIVKKNTKLCINSQIFIYNH